MKYRIICLAAVAALAVAGLAFLYLDDANGGARYHQHLEQPGEGDLEPCAVCGGTAALCTHLPILRIETGGQKIPGKGILDDSETIVDYERGDNGEEQIVVSLSTVEEEGRWHHADDEADIQSQALFRVRGNSSRAFSKSSYRIKLIEDGDPEKNRSLPLLGMSSGNEWALHGPFLDKTLIRNYMWMNISAEIMGYAPNVRFCEVILDGEYQGVYVLMETIGVSPGRVNLTPYEDGDAVTSYIVHIEPRADPLKVIDNFTQYTLRIDGDKALEILYPTGSHLNDQVKNYVNADFSEVERILYSARAADRSDAISDVVDIGSFVDYYILMEFLAINDMFSASTYFYRDVRGKLAAGPVWDYNNALDNFFQPFDSEGFLLSQRGWMARLMMDEDFVSRVVFRYRQLRQGILSEENLLAYTDEVILWLGSAVDRNFAVWGYSFDPDQLGNAERRRPNTGSGLTVYDVNPSSFEQAVAWMKDYMIDRGRWLDQHIESLYQYCRESKLATERID